MITSGDLSIELLERVERYWYGKQAALAAIRPAKATDEAIVSFEESHRVKLPADLRSYFLRLNGIAEDPDMFCFWPLSRVVPVASRPFNVLDSNSYFLFADYLIESNYYAIYLGDDPFFQNRVILPDYPNEPVIAQTFSEFLELYLQDDGKLYGRQ